MDSLMQMMGFATGICLFIILLGGILGMAVCLITPAHLPSISQEEWPKPEDMPEPQPEPVVEARHNVNDFRSDWD